MARLTVFSRRSPNQCSTLQWRHNGRGDVSNHQPHHCLHSRSFRRRSKKTAKLRVTGFCEGNSPVTGEYPAQMASNAENVSIWLRHHGDRKVVNQADSCTDKPVTAITGLLAWHRRDDKPLSEPMVAKFTDANMLYPASMSLISLICWCIQWESNILWYQVLYVYTRSKHVLTWLFDSWKLQNSYHRWCDCSFVVVSLYITMTS